jgi:2-dehydropantoate 2-reductase
VEYVVVGAGAIGGTIGAQLRRDGHDVLLCDADPEHVAVIERDGLTVEGPLERFTVRAPAVTPDALPRSLGAVLLAVKAHHTADAAAALAPRLAPDGYVASLQNGLNGPAIAAAVGADRVVEGFVNFGADVVAPGRIMLGGRGTIRIGEPDGRTSDRARRLAADIPGAEPTANIRGYLWAKLAYGAMLAATAISGVPIADALAEPAYRPVFLALAREVLARCPVAPEAFDGFDPADLDGSIERLVAFNRRSAKAHSGIYRDLAVRRRPTEVPALFAAVDGPLVGQVVALVRAIEAGERTPEPANLALVAAHERLERLGRPLNAVVRPLAAPARAPAGPLHGQAVAVKDNVDVAGVVTTNASAVAVLPPAAADAPVVARLRAAGADLLCKTNLLEYAAGSVSPAYGMTRNPHDPGRTSGGSSSGSAALVAAGVCDHAVGTDTGGSIRIPAAYCGIVGLKPTYGLVPLDGVTPLAPTCDHVGPMTRTVAGCALLLSVMSGQACRIRPVAGVRVGVVPRQLADPDVDPTVRERVLAAIDALAGLGLAVSEVDIPELALVDEALTAIILYEAWQVHAERFRREADRYGPETRALLELGRGTSEASYRAALADAERVRAGFDAALARVDVIAGPTAAYTAPAEDPPVGTPEGDIEARFTGPANLSRGPAVSMPCGTVAGMPVALQLVAAPGRDDLVLSVAAAYEEVAGAHP